MREPEREPEPRRLPAPDAVLLALGLVSEGHLAAGEAADLIGEASSAGGDQFVALQEHVVARRPDLRSAVSALGEVCVYVPLDCRACGGRFRARPAELESAETCPLCGEALASRLRPRLPARQQGTSGRAAEAAGTYAPALCRRFAHFQLQNLLGGGGAGQVFRAVNRRTGARVAVKLLDFEPLESVADSLRKLRQEARATASVRHPNVVPVLDLGVAEGIPFVEMELVEGPSLTHLVRREGCLARERAAALLQQALCGLGAVHAARIVHGDVKPGNILVDRAGCARLTDFGLATFLEETTSLSTTSTVVGSPHFMAPEQWRGEALSPATDLYAMGMVLYFALTGRLPWEGERSFALMFHHLHEPLLPAGASHYPIPDALAQVIRRATEKDPAERFGDAGEFAAALRHAESEEGAGSATNRPHGR